MFLSIKLLEWRRRFSNHNLWPQPAGLLIYCCSEGRSVHERGGGVWWETNYYKKLEEGGGVAEEKGGGVIFWPKLSYFK